MVERLFVAWCRRSLRFNCHRSGGKRRLEVSSRSFLCRHIFQHPSYVVDLVLCSEGNELSDVIVFSVCRCFRSLFFFFFLWVLISQLWTLRSPSCQLAGSDVVSGLRWNTVKLPHSSSYLLCRTVRQNKGTTVLPWTVRLERAAVKLRHLEGVQSTPL